jgi:branched-chain amino acid transport system permease protein
MFGLTQGSPLVDEKAGCPDMIRACLRAHPRGCSSSHLIINGGLARAIHAPIALAFVLVYKTSRMINFSTWRMDYVWFAACLHRLPCNRGLDLGGAMLFGCVATALLDVGFNGIVGDRLVMRPVISLIMVTLGLGALMRRVAHFDSVAFPVR